MSPQIGAGMGAKLCRERCHPHTGVCVLGDHPADVRHECMTCSLQHRAAEPGPIPAMLGESVLAELARQQRGALLERLGEAAFEVHDPGAEPAVPARSRVAVGGSLHGRVLLVPVASQFVYCDRGASIEVVRESDGGNLNLDGVTFRATQKFELYEVRDHARTSNGNVGLIIAAELLKSAGSAGRGKGLDETIVEALGIAAGVHGRSTALSRQLLTTEGIRKAAGFDA